MLQFILRRLGLVIPTFIGITLLTFAFVHMIPGDPVMIMAGERGISPERHAQLLAELGLDKPMWQQYLHYIWGVMHGDLGISLKSRIPVWDEFVPRFKATLELGVCAMIFAVAVGIPVGVLAAVKRGSIFDHTAVGLNCDLLAGISSRRSKMHRVFHPPSMAQWAFFRGRSQS